MGSRIVNFGAPYLQLDLQSELASRESSRLRGVADSIALRLVHSNAEYYSERKPDSPVEQLVFEVLEQLRCESLVPKALPGMRSNLRIRFLFWANNVTSSKLIENDIGLLIFTVFLVAWSRIQRQLIPEQLEEVVESTRWGFSVVLKSHLQSCAKTCDNQAAFARHALVVAQEVQGMIEQNELTSPSGNKDSESSLEHLRELNLLNLNFTESEPEEGAGTVAALSQDALSSHKEKSRDPDSYRIYNSEFDMELAASASIRAAQLQKMRSQLDKRLQLQSVNKHRVARLLQQTMAQPKLLAWSFGEEEGYLDSARLSRVITNPQDKKLFKRESNQAVSDCAVSILIDNSGSMTHHNEFVAALVDTLGHTLEIAQCKTEVLGFTTTDWNGGKVLQQWKKNGEPEQPGRLNSVCHIVYKSLDIPWRRARVSIAALLRTDRFKEGIDGEAIQWAAKRLETRPERRKIILVISDGSPMDTATHAANYPQYLDNHLMQVVKDIELRGDLKICAVGIGLDLSAYYQQSLAINTDKNLEQQTLFEIAELLRKAV